MGHSLPSFQLAERLEEAQRLALEAVGTEETPKPDESQPEGVAPDPPSPPPESTGDGVGHPTVEGALETIDEIHGTANDIGTEETPKPDEIRAEGVTPEPPSSSPVLSGDGVGHPMVEGALEAIDEIHDKANGIDTRLAEQAEPAALDPEVAEVVAREEAKDALPLTPSPVQAISPVSPSLHSPRETSNGLEMTVDEEMQRGDVLTPPLPPIGLPVEDGISGENDNVGQRKRARSDEASIPGPVKRRRQNYDTQLPPSLSHLRHPPTSTLYITNLRRPLIHSALHEYLFPTTSPLSDRLPSARPPFASSDHPNLWLSGVKDHAYATYPTVEAALAEAERVESKQWPQETGDKLHVEFIPDELVRGLVDKEQSAWGNGRQKLTLQINQPSDDGTGQVEFELSGRGSIGIRPAVGRQTGMGRPPAFVGLSRPLQPVITGANAIRPPPGAPTGPAAGVGVVNRARATPPHLARPRNGDLTSGPGLGPPRGLRPGTGEGRLVNPMRRTQFRPGLFWKEGPESAHKRG